MTLDGSLLIGVGETAAPPPDAAPRLTGAGTRRAPLATAGTAVAGATPRPVGPALDFSATQRPAWLRCARDSCSDIQQLSVPDLHHQFDHVVERTCPLPRHPKVDVRLEPAEDLDFREKTEQKEGGRSVSTILRQFPAAFSERPARTRRMLGEPLAG
jgi:hypothetical protein